MIAISGRVYNVTPYIQYHPGGSWAIESRCGQEVTGLFASIHSNYAWSLLERYYVADFAGQSKTANPSVLDAIAREIEKQNPGAVVSNIKPRRGLFVATVLYNGEIYEEYIDRNFRIVKEENLEPWDGLEFWEWEGED